MSGKGRYVCAERITNLAVSGNFDTINRVTAVGPVNKNISSITNLTGGNMLILQGSFYAS
jgi:hypothetical protein